MNEEIAGPDATPEHYSTETPPRLVRPYEIHKVVDDSIKLDDITVAEDKGKPMSWNYGKQYDHHKRECVLKRKAKQRARNSRARQARKRNRKS